MSVFLGNSGHVELRRDAANQALRTQLDPNDVNVDRNRFSVDGAEGSLIAGDQVTIATVNQSPLKLVDGHIDPDTSEYFPDWRGYISVDDAGGLRLYSNFSDAIGGAQATALQLVAPDAAVEIVIQTRDTAYNCLAQVTNYELTTSRDQVQTDVLGDEFRSYYEAGMISGQGQLDCFWQHESGICEDDNNSEFSSYLARLVIRLKQGSSFNGRFYVYCAPEEPAVWYECECLVSNVALSVNPTQVVATQIQFVATGPIVLHTGMPEANVLLDGTTKGLGVMLQEDGAAVLQEDSD